MYRVTSPDEILEYPVCGISATNNDTLDITILLKYRRALINVSHDATEGVDENGNTFYFNLDDAEIEQFAKRERVVKTAYENMCAYQSKYHELSAKYMFAEPSKPIKG